jgi:hypothetical protein
LACSVILVLSAFAWFVPCRTDQCASTYAAADPQGQLAAPLPNNPCACADKSSDPNETTHWYTSPEWWLVIVAAPTLVLVWYQSRETARSARAAEDGIKLMIDKERARLTLDLDDLDLSPKDGAYEVKLKVSIFGTTPAFILGTKCAAFIGPKELMDDPEASDRAMHPFYSFPSVIPPGSNPTDAFAFIGFATEDGIDFEIQAVKQQDLFVGIRGFIAYRDVFDRERRTSFRYFCEYSEIPGLARGWVKCGQPEENQAT